MRRIPTVLATLILVLAGAPAARAVKPASWVHEQPKDFTAAQLDNVVVTSRGEVMLGRKTDTLHAPGPEAEVINALALAGDGRVYAATGPRGIIYRVEGDKVTQFARLPGGGTVFSLLFAVDGTLLAGTGGAGRARIYRINGEGKAAVFYEPPEASYVWAMTRGDRGEVYAATGAAGGLFVIEPGGGQGRLLCKVKTRNLLCLTFGPDGMLYGGTDEDGLVYRFNPATGKPFVLYDAREAEISAIAIDAEGNLFAATASAENARPGRSVAEAPGGRPDHAETRPAASAPAAGKPEPPATRKTDADDEEPKPPPQRGPVRVTILAQPMGKPVQASKPAPTGNAIYRIDADGFVTEVFREPVMILALAEENGTLHAATGNEGRVYAIAPGREKTVVLAKLKAAQVTSLLRLPKGGMLLGTANEALLVRLSDRNAPRGTLVSEPLDAEQIVKWGRVSWDASVPQGTRLTVATRSGNVEDKESEAWDAWSAEADATAPQQIASPGARFLQYRLTFETSVPDATPVLRRLTIPRIDENRAPRITELKVASAFEAAKDPNSPPRVKALAAMGMAAPPGDKPTPQPDYFCVAMFKVEDPNQDPLQFQVFYREIGRQRWIRMAKELEEPFYVWDTRTVPDGRYEIRVLADDNPGNPPGSQLTDARVSDAVLVDNTPPDVTLTATAGPGRGRASFHATLTDALSFIAEASYNLDSDEKWTPLNALDDIFDSPSEAVSFTLDSLAPGEHRVALRVRDQKGNLRVVSQAITITE